MEPLETVIQLAQKCLTAMPVIVLGSGSSAAYGIGGMDSLQAHLLDTVQPATLQEIEQWAQFKQVLAETNDLEATLQQVQVTDGLLSQIVRETRSTVLGDDIHLFERLADGETQLSLVRLFKHLFRSTHSVLSIVTPNYDRLAEYAADVAHFNHHTGFTQGYYRHFLPNGRSTPRRNASSRTVEVWKVHGSIDWFLNADGVAVALPYRDQYPETFTPLLVTPGTSKYEITHQEPFRSIMANADAALSQANSYLCIGYGFNDRHIQPKLVERARHDGVPIVILAKTLSDPAKAFISGCKNRFLLALEDNGATTKAYTCGPTDCCVDVPSASLWDLAQFLDITITDA